MTDLLCETIDGEQRIVRQLEFARLARALAERRGALLVPRESVGPGIGTSSLVARYIQSSGDRYRRVIRLCARHEVQWQSDLVRACIELGLPEQQVPRPDAPAAALRHALHAQSDGMLVWLDDVVELERIAPFVEEWESLRHEGKTFHLVVSSSEPTIQMAPFDDPICLAGLTPGEALRWCLQHVPRECMQGSDVEAAGVICEYLGYHPLAIRMVAVAAREAQETLTQMLSDLQRTMAQDHQTPLVAASRSLVDRLRKSAPATIETLARLTCLPAARCGNRCVRDVQCELNGSHIETLRRWGLVSTFEGTARIASEPLRVAIFGALTPPERDTAIQSMLAWGESDVADSKQQDASAPADLDRLETIWPLIQVTSTEKATQNDSRKLLEFAVDSLDRIGACNTAVSIVDTLLETPRSADGLPSKLSTADCLERRGDIHLRRHDYLQARKDYRECHQLLHAAQAAESEMGLRVSLSIIETDLHDCRLQRAATRLVAAERLLQSLRVGGMERLRFLVLRGAYHLQTGKAASAYALLRRAADEAHLLPNDAPLKHRIRFLLSRTCFRQNKLREAEKVLNEDIDVRSSGSQALPLDAAVPQLMLADLLMAAGRFAEAEPLYRQVLKTRRHSLGRRHRLCGETAGRLAVALAQYGDYRSADPLFQESLAIHEAEYGAEHPELAHVLNEYSKSQFLQGRYESAKQMCERALSIQEQSLSNTDQRIARTRNNLAALYVVQGTLERAEDLYRRDLEVKRASFSAMHPLVAAALNNLGNVCQSLAQFDEADQHFTEALRIRRHRWPNGHVELAQSLNSLGHLRLCQRQYAEAMPLLRESLQIREAVLSAVHPHLAVTCEAIGEVLFRQGEFEESLAFYQRALTICEGVYGDRHQRFAHVLARLGRVEARHAKYARAELHLRKAEQILRQSVGANHPYYADVLCGLAELEQCEGHDDAACSLLADAAGIFRSATGFELAASDALLSFGRILLRRRVIADAAEQLTECLDLRVRVLGDKHLETAQARLALATAFITTSNVDRADLLLDAAITVFKRHGDTAHDWLAEAFARKVDVAVARSKLTDAEMLLSNRLEMESQESENPLDRVTLLSRLAGVRQLREDYAATVPLVRECIGIIEQQRGTHHPDLVAHLDVLAGVYVRLGLISEAESLLQRAVAILERLYGEQHPAVLELLKNHASLLAKCDLSQEAAAVRNRISRLQHRHSHVLGEIM